MDTAFWCGWCRQCQIKLLGCELGIEQVRFHRFLAGRKGIRNRLAGAINLGSFTLSLFRRHLPERLEQQRNFTLFSKRSNANGFQRIAVGCSADQLQIMIFDRFDVAHHSILFFSAARLATLTKNPIKKRREIALRRFFEIIQILKLLLEHPAPV